MQDLVGQQAELEKLCEDMNLQMKTLEESLAQTAADKKALESEREQDCKVMKSLTDQLSTKEASLVANQQSIKVLQQDLEEAEKQVDLMTQRMEANKAEMSRLQRCEASNTDLQEHISELRADRQVARDQLADVMFEIEELKSDAQAKAAEYREATEKLQGDMARAKAQIEELQEDKERLRRQFIEFSDTKDLIAASEGLEKRIFELENELASSKATGEASAARVEHLLAEKQALEELVEELKVLKRDHASLGKDLEEAKEKLRKQEEQSLKFTESLEQRHAAAVKETSELKLSLARTAEENKLQLQEVYELRAVNAAIQREIDRCVSEQTAGGDRMLQRIKELTDKSEKAECEVARLHESLDTLKGNAAETLQSLKVAQCELAQTQQGAAKMETALELKGAELARMTEARDALQAQLSEANQACSETRHELKDCTSKLLQLEAQHSKFEAAEVERLKESLHAAERRAQEFELEVAKMQSKCELLEQERVSTQRMLESKDSSGAQVMETVSKLCDELQQARAESATLQLSLDRALSKLQAKEELLESLKTAGIQMETALTAKISQADDLESALNAAVQEKAAARAEMQGKIDAAEQAKQGVELELAEAQKALTAAQKEAAELRASSGASANAIIESCEKRLRILEYDLVSKQEEISRLEKVKDDAFHKMTLMKAEYTGRVKRREDKIAELEGKVARLTGATPAPSFSASDDKENDLSLVSNGKSASNGPSQSCKASKSSTQTTEEGAGAQSEVISATKRSTRSSAKASAPIV
jgi:chromosome segregation ATPase